MKVFINNEENILSQENTITSLLEALKIPAERGVAIAINNKVITKASWNVHSLKENDKITIIKATQGG